MIVPRDHVLLALIRALAYDKTEAEATAAVAAELCIPEESVRDVITTLHAPQGA